MVIKPFAYLSPSSLQEACEIAYTYPEDSKLLAGGQSLLPILKLNLAEFKYVVDLKKIPGLSFVKLDKNQYSNNMNALFVGALTTHDEVANSRVVRTQVPLLSETAGGIGHPLVRHRGTMGGSISHSDPAADLCATAVTLGAKMIVMGRGGSRRVIDADRFFVGPFSTSMEKGEILEQVCFPVPEHGTGYSFKKIMLGHGDFPLALASVLLGVVNGVCNNAVITLGSVADTPMRATEAEKSLVGRSNLGPADFERAGELARAGTNPSSDLETSAEYKKKMVGVMVKRALTEAMTRTGESLR